MKTKRSTFKVLFYVKRTAVRVSDGKAPVMARITIGGDIATFGAKLFVTPSLWNAEAGKVSGKSAEALEISTQLEEIKARINNHYHQIIRAKSTYNKYLIVYKHLEAFINDFDSYLRNEKGLSYIDIKTLILLI